jgi:hypothetical protein
MQRYLEQLLADIAISIDNEKNTCTGKLYDLWDWISQEEEERTARIRNLQEWTGIYQEMLPPAEMLSDEQLHSLLEALLQLLNTYNCCFVLQTTVPERIQYATIKDNFDQDVKVKTWHMGFFSLCKPNTEHGKCTLGEHCQCAFYVKLFAGFVDEHLSPEEERARMLEIEIKHLKRKYDDDWMKYYPYHLDKAFDDEDGNPYNYGIEDEEDDE